MTDINFVDVNAYQLLNEMVNNFELTIGEKLLPGDERSMLVQNLLPIVVALKNDINDSARQNLLRFARGEVLDAIGELRNTIRHPAQSAIVTLEFNLSSIQAVPVTVNKGTRCTADGRLLFATVADMVIPAGQLSGTVNALATETGVDYNWFAVGTIKNMVDPVQYVSSVRNTTESSGGSDIEDDDSYRERIRQSPESFSVAGPEGAYEFWTKTADNTIVDVSVTSPSAGIVKIVPLLEGGNIPEQPILDKVSMVLNARDKRPLTDNVQVAPPNIKLYDIDFTYYIPLSRQTDEAVIKGSIEGPGGVVDKFKLWQSSQLGKSINPDQLRLMVLSEGAFRIVVNSPAFTELNTDDVAKAGNINVTYGGLG